MDGAANTAADAAAGEIAHGGRLAEARRRFPDAPEPFIDLSTGINPVPYPFSPLLPEAFTRLPEPEALWALQSAAAARYGVADPAMVAAAPGTQVLINLLPRLFPQARVSVLGPTYAEHAACWSAAGAEVRAVTRFDELGGDAAVVCNPNNPDGSRHAPADLLALAGRSRLLVVDEAFADFEGSGLSLAPYLPHSNVIVLRSFGKAYGLAGVRLGFALASARTASVIREALGPWAVSGPAIQIGTQALADAEWVGRTARQREASVARLDVLLGGMGRVLGGTSLFRLLEAPDAMASFEKLGRVGILVRRFNDRPQALRFGIPAEGQWHRLEAQIRV
jgi:cobalamin biosynthetic protein CobC